MYSEISCVWLKYPFGRSHSCEFTLGILVSELRSWWSNSLDMEGKKGSV